MEIFYSDGPIPGCPFYVNVREPQVYVRNLDSRAVRNRQAHFLSEYRGGEQGGGAGVGGAGGEVVSQVYVRNLDSRAVRNRQAHFLSEYRGVGGRGGAGVGEQGVGEGEGVRVGWSRVEWWSGSVRWCLRCT